jgi:translation elongation factor EF-Ts
MPDCKKALDEAEGNFEKALQIISKDYLHLVRAKKKLYLRMITDG